MKRSCAVAVLILAIPIGARAADNRQAVLQSLSAMLDTAYEIEHYALLHDHFPDAGTPADLAVALGNPSLENAFLDAWGTQLRISIDPAEKTYTIVSAGSDRAFAPATWSYPDQLNDVASDQVIRDGQIVRSALKWAQPPGKEADAFADALVWSKAVRTMADVRTLAAAVESYAADHKEYPRDLEILGTVPQTDGWGKPLKYVSDGAKYQIVSAGADHRFDPPSWTIRELTPDLNKDLVFANGEFVRAWQADPGSALHRAWGSVIVSAQRLADLHNLTPQQRRTARIDGLLELSDQQFQRRTAAQNAFITSFRFFAEAASVDPDAVGRDRLARYANEFRRDASQGAVAPVDSNVRIPVTFYERAEGKQIGRELLPILQRFVEKHPGDQTALLALADVTDTIESPARAADVLESDLRQRPGDAAAWIRLAQLDIQTKNNEKALAAVDTAIAMPNLTTEQMTDISGIYAQLGKRRRVLEIAREQVASKADNPEALFFFGKTAYEAATYDTVSDAEKRSLLSEGETALRRALKLSPQHVESMAYLNLILRQRASLESDPAAAKKMIEEADELRDQARFILRSRKSS